MRKIPTTMASQHPDHASKPYWLDREYIRVADETEECYRTYTDLGIGEYKWDWEGKFVDEAVIERLLGEHFEYFKEHPLGKENFLTFRLPNPKVETEFRMGRALMGILVAAGLARQVGLHSPPLFEVILPMTETAEEMLAVQEAFAEITSLSHPLLKLSEDIKHVELIPLFEEAEIIANTHKILKKYVDLHKARFGKKPDYMRPYVARSDPALNAGIVPTVLAIACALSNFARFEKEEGIPLYPIIGSASLPFRGGITPYNTSQFTAQYAGVRTVLIQSAYRYDYPLESVKKGIEELAQTLPALTARHIEDSDQDKLAKIGEEFTAAYRAIIPEIAPLINSIAKHIPKRRERVQHVGLFGYSRGVGGATLPRAIGFTAALYSIGVPPEFLGTAAGITNGADVSYIEKFYINLRSDLTQAGKYLNKANLAILAKESNIWAKLEQDIASTEEALGITFGPETQEQKEHEKLTTRLLSNLQAGEEIQPLLVEAAVLRRSMG